MAPRTRIAAFALAAVAWCVPAFADGDVSQAELATARALFEEGVTREDAKDWNGALERFKRVADIRVTPQVLYNMGLCYERLDKTMTADVYYARAEKGNAPDLAKLATARRADLKSKIPSVVLDGPTDLTFTLDGKTAPLGTPLPLDPGKHELVTHRGAQTGTKSFELTTTRLNVTLPDPASAAAAAAARAIAEEHFRRSYCRSSPARSRSSAQVLVSLRWFRGRRPRAISTKYAAQRRITARLRPLHTTTSTACTR